MLFFLTSNFPKQSLPLRGPSYESLNSLEIIGLASRWGRRSLQPNCGAVDFVDSALFRILLWLHGNSTLRTAQCSSFIAWASKCFCSPCHTQTEKLRNLSSTLVIIKMLQKRQHWRLPFLFWSINIDFSSKTIGIIRLFGVPLFCSRGCLLYTSDAADE